MVLPKQATSPWRLSLLRICSRQTVRCPGTATQSRMTRRKKPPAYERISVQLPAELVRFLDQQARADMTTRPTVVRQLVAAAQKQARTAA